jgi:predicted DNA-binding antitoxin AbrB/MazE fold protein
MPEIITAIYENGVLRPLSPLPLQEHQTVRIQVLLEDSGAELERITQSLATAGLITSPPCRSDVEPVSEDAWRELIEKLKAISGQCLSEILIEERGNILLPTLENLPEGSSNPSVPSLSDTEVLALANSKMDAVQNQRVGELQQRGKTTGLTEAERYELLALLQIYQLGQLRKSEALAEAVQRGLRSHSSSPTTAPHPQVNHPDTAE